MKDDSLLIFAESNLRPGQAATALQPVFSSGLVRKNLTTAEAALLLNRSPQTLRSWACLENGPIRPGRIHGRLAWPLDEIVALTNGSAK